jgi:endonuclease YncB( thermonuclease family)
LLGPARQRQLAARIPSPGYVLGRSRAFARVAPCVLARLGLRTATCRCSLRQLALALACLALTGCADEARELEGTPSASARVTRHTDGDTLWLSGLGKVRLIGIDTPEVFGETECYGRASSAFMRRVAPLGSKVRYRLGVEARDRYGRALVYVWLRDGRFLNRLVLLRGFGEPITIPPNVAYVAEFERAAAKAREAGRGLWGRRGCAG